MVIKVLCFSTIYISSVASSAQSSECFYKKLSKFNLLMQLVFNMVDVNFNRITYLVISTYLKLGHTQKNLKCAKNHPPD